MDIEYSKLEMQEYLLCGDRNTSISKFIFKARGCNLDIKTQKKWKYDDNITYSWFYGNSVSEQISVAKLMMIKLKTRQKLREEVI